MTKCECGREAEHVCVMIPWDPYNGDRGLGGEFAAHPFANIKPHLGYWCRPPINRGSGCGRFLDEPIKDLPAVLRKLADKYGATLPDNPKMGAIARLVEAANGVLETDQDPCVMCGQDIGEGEGLCSPECCMNELVIALRPFQAEAPS